MDTADRGRRALGTAVAAQETAAAPNQPTPDGTVSTNLNFPVESIVTPTYSDQQCADCRSVAPPDSPYCLACGGHLQAREKSRVAYHAIGAFIGIGAVLLYWLGTE